MSSPVLYLGPEGTHTHEAALKRFGAKTNLIPCLSHYEVFARLCDARKRPRPLAIMPVENSSEGPVTQTLDQLATHPKVTIADSFSLSVPQHLMALPKTKRSGIQQVCSHPQALGQCRTTLAKLLPKAELITESSTAAAARRAAQQPGTAAVASGAAARIHGLSILKKDIQDGEQNVTRFFTLTASQRPIRSAVKSKERRSLIYLVIGNRPGALLHVLSPFDASEVNLTFIQSRPLPGRPWEYGFFIEAVTDWKSARAQAAWKLVLALAESGRKIGTYPVL